MVRDLGCLAWKGEKRRRRGGPGPLLLKPHLYSSPRTTRQQVFAVKGAVNQSRHLSILQLSAHFLRGPKDLISMDTPAELLIVKFTERPRSKRFRSLQSSKPWRSTHFLFKGSSLLSSAKLPRYPSGSRARRERTPVVHTRGAHRPLASFAARDRAPALSGSRAPPRSLQTSAAKCLLRASRVRRQRPLLHPHPYCEE